MKGEIHVIRTGVLGVNTCIVPLCDNKVFVVDPAACRLSGDESKIAEYLKSKKLECVAIILTHSHFDHITGIEPVKKAFPQAVIAVHESEFAELQNPPGPMNQSVVRFFGAVELFSTLQTQPPAEVKLYSKMRLGSLLGQKNDIPPEKLKVYESLEEWEVVHTPGHTPGSVCLYNAKNGLLISGDTLFDYGGYGRTDMYGGDEAQIMASLSLIRNTIPAGTRVYPGHDSFGFSL